MSIIEIHDGKEQYKNIIDIPILSDIKEYSHIEPFSERTNAVRFEVLKKLFPSISIDGELAEFGVYKGGTAKLIMEYFPNKKLHLFDSFEGLPEDWVGSFKKGVFATSVPKFNSDNVIIHKGWFSDTISPFKQNYTNQLAFIHIDCDLYSSTIDVLFGINDLIVKGTIIEFDDLLGIGTWYEKEWKEGEYKALVEWAKKFNRSYKFIGRSTHMQAAILVTH